jgi:hypothetical protein
VVLAGILVCFASAAPAALPADVTASCWTGGRALHAVISVKPRLFPAERVSGRIDDELCFGPLPARDSPARPELAADAFHLRWTDRSGVSLVLEGSYAQDATGRVVFIPDAAALAEFFEELLEIFLPPLPVSYSVVTKELELDAKAVGKRGGDRTKLRARVVLVVNVSGGGRQVAITVKLGHRVRLGRAPG